MKKRNLFIAGLLLCAVSFSGCDPDKEKNTLSVSGAANSALSFAAKDNADVTLTVTTDASKWGYSAPAWVTATKSGKTLVVNVNENTGGMLEGTIEFTAGTADPVRISVTQAAALTVKNTLSVSPNSAISFKDKDNADVTLTVTTNASEWNFDKPSWVTATKSGNTLVVNVDENTGGKLDGTITFTAGNADAFNISVSQAAPGGATGITIDGSFTDWAEISATKTGVAGMLEAKYYSDGTDLFMYFKANQSAVPTTEETNGTDLVIYLDADNNNTTGQPMGYAFGNDTNANGMEYFVSLFIASKWGAQNPIGRWSSTPYIKLDGWVSEGTDDIKGEKIVNCVNGIGAFNGGYYEVEMQVKLATLPWTLSSPFRLAVRLDDYSGVLPNYIPVYEWTWK